MRKVYETEMRALEAGKLIDFGDDGLVLTISDYKLTINLLNFDKFWGITLRDTSKANDGSGRLFALGFNGLSFVNIFNFIGEEIHLNDVFNDRDR